MELATKTLPSSQPAQSLRLLATALLAGTLTHAQTTTTPPPTAAPTPAGYHYLQPTALPGIAAPYLVALGPELNVTGSEIVVLTGTLTDAAGSSPITITRQLDQNLRIDIGGTNPTTIIAANLLGIPTVTASLSAEYTSLLETLLDDTPEAFLYGFADGTPFRWIGGRFRTDDGTTPDYQGPWYNIFLRATTLAALPGAPVRAKFTLLDSITSLYTSSRYTAAGAMGAEIQVVVTYSGWTAQNGQAVPGTITRTENGATVFTVQITSKSNAPAQSNLFNQP